MIDFVSYRSTDRLTGDQLKKAESWENTPKKLVSIGANVLENGNTIQKNLIVS